MADEVKRMHSLNIGKKIMVTGVKNVESYDDKNIVIELADTMLYIFGNDFAVDTFSVEEGKFIVTGTVHELKYSKTRDKMGFFKKLLK